ncbi:MAG: tRNA threonylcarbamoyladenosine dehydratase [Alphaproteobacteria bacterium]|nr:tRNA threonylcarbamoyladenosine dehydratase [Alphaproteobacteria bacterium]
MVDERFMRTALLLGDDGLKRLENATVAVIGLGAVGGYALEALARAGIGRLILVDFDVFEPTNINRQLLALTSTLGQKKVEAAKNRVMDINPKCKVELQDCFVNIENFDEIFENKKIDFVVDAIDSIKEKCAMMAYLFEHNIPFVSAMGAALKTDVSALKYAKLSNTAYCTMARKIRKNLKTLGVDEQKIDCVYSSEPNNGSEKQIIKNQAGKKAVLGSLPTVTAIMGLMLAHHVILSLAKKEKRTPSA